jgi:D-glycerate 3-kinase
MASSHSDTDVFSSPLPYIIPHILANVTDRTPLFVAFQGPQGAGKTYLSSLLHRTLTSPPHSFSVAVLSIDDLYLPHSSLVALADAHPLNALLKGRGLPGTHDVPLGIKVLSELKNLNKRLPGGTPGQVTLPSFNKSLYDGEGDRSSSGVVVAGPLDIVILEGWCTGFCPITNEELEKRWEESNTHGVGDLGYNIGEKWRIEDIREVNQRLREYVELWTFFDIFIQVRSRSFLAWDSALKRPVDQTGPRVTLFLHIQVEAGAGTLHEGEQWRKGYD